MTTTRRKRIVRGLLLGLLLAGTLIAWRSARQPPEIRQSLPLRVGMTEAEVETVMGASKKYRIEKWGGDY